MPIFEYRCAECGTKFEKLVRGNTTEILCPSCGKDRVNKELSTFAAHSHSGGSRSESALPPCASGMCPHPDVCGRN